MKNDRVVHVIDDDAAVRDSLTFLLASSGYRARAYESAEAFLTALSTIDSGCVITDVRMPGVSGIELLERLREANATLPVIVVTGHGDIALAVEAMKLGAADFLEKPFDDVALLGALRGACERMLRSDVETSQRGRVAEKLASLSGREREVLDGLVAGKANKAIAYDLGISPRTVEVYRANLMTKMQANSLSDLVRMALIGGALDEGGATAD